MTKTGSDNSWNVRSWSIGGLLLSVAWWVLEGQFSFRRTILLVCLSLSSFVVGAILGFLFTSYGPESNTFGKIRDWLVGGITALTVAKASSIKETLVLFAAGPGATEYALVIGSAVLYAGLGFMFMFLQRELILNTLLAQSRAERGRLEGSIQAGQVILSFLSRVPTSVLTGVDFREENPDLGDQEMQRLKTSIYSDDVQKFLDQAEQAAKAGTAEWDVVSKCAYVYYYRTIFKTESQDAELEKAVEWITRALNMNPRHIELTMKYAEVLGSKQDYLTAVAILERLNQEPLAPMVVRQWLGYYLRFVSGRADDVIRYSEQYHEIFPDETDSLFSSAYGYAQKYCEDLRKQCAKELPGSANRKKCLTQLQIALQDQPEMKEVIKTKWLVPGRPFECLKEDAEFCQLIGLQPSESSESMSGVGSEVFSETR